MPQDMQSVKSRAGIRTTALRPENSHSEPLHPLSSFLPRVPGPGQGKGLSPPGDQKEEWDRKATEEYGLAGGWPGARPWGKDGLQCPQTQGCTHLHKHPPLGSTAQSPGGGCGTQKRLLWGTRAGPGPLALQGPSWNLQLPHEITAVLGKPHPLLAGVAVGGAPVLPVLG